MLFQIGRISKGGAEMVNDWSGIQRSSLLSRVGRALKKLWKEQRWFFFPSVKNSWAPTGVCYG